MSAKSDGSVSLADDLKAAKNAVSQPAPRPLTVPDGAPAGTVGGVQDTPPFRWTKAIAYQQGRIGPQEAKHEIEACRQFRESLEECHSLPTDVGYNSMMVPLSSAMLTDDVRAHKGYRVMKSMMGAGEQGYDPDEAQWVANRVRKSQSYLTDNIGGTLVPPPVQGELIELVRPKQACMSAGATTVPLPPNGKITYPRQTSPSTAYWIGENTSITESQVGTDQVSLQAKKLAVFLTVPNELLKYASVAADALLKSDASKTLALGFDNACLYGQGSSYSPTGLTLYTGTNQLIDYAGLTPAPKGIGAVGNTLRPEDGPKMIGLVEDRNFEFEGWITRPTLANNITAYRADAVAPGDAAGGFVQSVMRLLTDRTPGDNWCGYKMTKSAVVKNTQTKSTATNLTDLFGGQWSNMLLGMYGAVELTSSNVAGSSFQNDQTYVRAIMLCDMALRYQGSFIRYQQLLQTN